MNEKACRAAKVAEMRSLGFTWSEIATTLGYADPGAAKKEFADAAKSFLEEEEPSTKEQVASAPVEALVCASSACATRIPIPAALRTEDDCQRYAAMHEFKEYPDRKWYCSAACAEGKPNAARRSVLKQPVRALEALAALLDLGTMARTTGFALERAGEHWMLRGVTLNRTGFTTRELLEHLVIARDQRAKELSKQAAYLAEMAGIVHQEPK